MGGGACVLSPTPISHASANKGSYDHHIHTETYTERDERQRHTAHQYVRRQDKRKDGGRGQRGGKGTFSDNLGDPHVP